MDFGNSVDQTCKGFLQTFFHRQIARQFIRLLIVFQGTALFQPSGPSSRCLSQQSALVSPPYALSYLAGSPISSTSTAHFLQRTPPNRPQALSPHQILRLLLVAMQRKSGLRTTNVSSQIPVMTAYRQPIMTINRPAMSRQQCW